MTESEQRMGIGPRRGQLVLLAGAAIAVALVALLGAYLQLGYHADVTTSGVADRPVENGLSFLDRAAYDSARDLRGEYAGSERAAAVTAFRDRTRPRLETLEASRVTAGVAYGVEYNESAANGWASERCPRGPAREFGPCRTDRGVVTQERNGRTHVLAAAFDLTVTTERGTTAVTTVVDATGS